MIFVIIKASSIYDDMRQSSLIYHISRLQKHRQCNFYYLRPLHKGGACFFCSVINLHVNLFFRTIYSEYYEAKKGFFFFFQNEVDFSELSHP